MITVETTSGPVIGSCCGEVLRFAGIPYAEPPIGALRWRPAQPVASWQEAREATEFGASAPQPYDPSGSRDAVLGGHGDPPFDEDCLTLNVWTPAADDARRPVLVWIHGGGFISGSGSLPYYHGDGFAGDGDLVVVTINYRIGPLGFWASADGGESNLWLTDQLAALRWIHANAEAFGGDPDQITVAGESGGAFSALTLATLPETSGLIRRVIAQSPPIGLALASAADAAQTAQAISGILGTETVDRLADVPADALIGATLALFPQTARFGHWSTPIRPVLDGNLLSCHPLDALLEGAGGHVDLLIGWNSHEATFSFALQPGMADLTEESVYGRLAERFHNPAEAYAEYRSAARAGHAEPVDVLAAIESDELFIRPVIDIARARSAQGRPAHVYEFAFETPAHGGALGATHCLELPFVFENLDRWAHAPFTHGIDPTRAERVSTRMHRAWIDFVRGQTPSGWPRHAEGAETLRFGDEEAVVSGAHAHDDLYAAHGLPMRRR
ncbi:MAG: carboxylesterase family protein [Microbacterium sp.]